MNLLILIAPMLVSGFVAFTVLALLQYVWEYFEELIEERKK